MHPEQEISIRPYREIYKAQVRNIAIDTAFMGEPGGIFWDDSEILADCLTGYYLQFEPESTFVAGSSDKIIGYLLGCTDTKRYNRIFNRQILPRIILNSLCGGALLKANSLRFAYHSLISLARGEFKRPDFSQEFPAHLHINIETQFRAKGIGTRLMEVFFNYIKDKSIKGIQAWTFSKRGNSLFKNLDFKLVYKQRVTYFDYLLQDQLFLSCWGKKL